MTKIQVNDQCYIDLDDTFTKQINVINLKYYSKKEEKYKTKTIQKTIKYARLVASKQFISNGNIIKENSKGAYVELVGILKNKVNFKLGNNSWIEGSFTGTKEFNSFVNKNFFMGEKSYIMGDAKISKNVIIGDNVHISYASNLGKNTIVGNNTRLYSVNLGKKTLIGDNCELGLHSFNNKTAIGGYLNIGLSPNYYNYYFWNKGIVYDTFKKEKISKFNKILRNLREVYYNNKTTRIGENVKSDCGCFIESGATVGNNAVLGYQVRVKHNSEVDNNKIIEDGKIL